MNIGDRFNYFRQHWFVKNVVTLQVGSFSGTIFQAIVGIFLARLLQPELFGVYSLAFGMASIGSFLLGAGNQEAVATLLGSAYAKKDSEEIKEVLAFLLKITVYAGSITLLFLLFFPGIAENFYGNRIIGVYASIIISAVFLSTSFNAVVQLGLQVVGSIKTLALVVFGDQFLRSGVSLLLVVFGFGVLGAVSGQLIGAFVVFLISLSLWRGLRAHYPLLPALRGLFGRVFKIAISKYFGFSFWVAVDRNMSNLYMALPVVLTGIFVSTQEVSFFKLSFGYVNLALSLLGPISILLNIEFPKMKLDDAEKLRKNFIKVSMYGVLLSTALTIAAVSVSPLAFKILYGESFTPSIKYVFGLVVYGALFGIGVGLGPMWRAINRVKVSIIINLIILGLGIPVGLWLINSFGNWGGVAMVTLWFTASHFLSFLYLMNNLKNDKKNDK